MGVYVVQEKGSEAVKIAEIRWVDVDKIEFDESVNLRSMTEDEFRLLVRSIAENGYVEPIQVVEYDGGKRFRVLNGFHRFKVLTDVFSMKTFPVVVVGRDWDEERFLQEMIRLNSIHGEFIPERVMEAVKRINSRSQYSQEELRQKLGFSVRGKMYRRLIRSLVESLPEGLRDEVQEKARRSTSLSEAIDAIKSSLYGGKKLLVINGLEYGIVLTVEPEVYPRLKAVHLEYDLKNVLTLMVDLWPEVRRVLGLGE